MFRSIILFLIFSHQLASGFMPAAIETKVFGTLQVGGFIENDQVVATSTHDEILEYGIIESIVQYFYDQPNGTRLVNLTKASSDYYDLRNLYYDYYGLWMCNLNVQSLISLVFRTNIGIVDLDASTKDLPYAHFDAETFVKSNERVMNMTDQVFTALTAKDYTKARELAGKVMHTIQDFYSHSNWVEMGNTDMNYDIGYSNFTNQAMVAANETNPCSQNCTLVTLQCSIYMSTLSSLLSSLSLSGLITCPTQYYKCGNNVILSKLVSGYYSDQKLEDGTAYPKPSNLGKCSHGGIFDKTSNQSSQGGINKDTGYYVISPHAHLHRTAVTLALKHSKVFFERIRARIGNSEYANFLDLTPTSSQFALARSNFFKCAAVNHQLASGLFILIFVNFILANL